MAGETTVTSVTNQVQTGYDLAADFALRSIPIFDQFSTEKHASTNAGSSVKFHRWTEIAEQTSALNEVTTPDPIALASTVLTVTPVEHGMHTVTTAKARVETMLPSFSADQVNLVAYNMATSLDTICRVVMDGTSEVRFIGSGTEGAILATDILTADEVRQEHAAIVEDNVIPFGQNYVWVINPFVAYDLKSETGDGAWIAPAQYVNTDKVYNNEIGVFGGFKFIESTRTELGADAGDTNVDVYTNYILGQENTAKAVFTAPRIVQGPVIDPLNRLVPLGWYALLDWDVFRTEAMRNIGCASSIGAN